MFFSHARNMPLPEFSVSTALPPPLPLCTVQRKLGELYITDTPQLQCVPELPQNVPPISLYKDGERRMCPTCTEAGQTLYVGDDTCKPCAPGSTFGKYGKCNSCQGRHLQTHKLWASYYQKFWVSCETAAPR